MPNTETFPFQSFQIDFKHNMDPIKLEGKDLEAALQYSATAGLPSLLQHLYELQGAEHGNHAQNAKIMVTTGSQDALTKAFDMLLDSAISVDTSENRRLFYYHEVDVRTSCLPPYSPHPPPSPCHPIRPNPQVE